MIDPSECFAAPLSAAEQMTFVVPRTDSEHRYLVVMSDRGPVAIGLDEIYHFGQYFAFVCAEQTHWAGLHVPGVRIELDESSLNEAQGLSVPRGAMVRSEDKLWLRVRMEGQYGAPGTSVTIMEGLPLCAQYQSGCFLKWQIVLGHGDDKRVLAKVDATPSQN